MILIISHPGDAHTQHVARALQRRGHSPFLLDFSRFPSRSSIKLDFGRSHAKCLHDAEWGNADLCQVRSVWWRRPQPFDIPQEITHSPYRMFATAEAREVFGGLSGLLDALWINVPERDDLAHRKVFQLRMAERLGLALPDTLVTTSPEAAREFIKRRGGANTVFKAFSGTPDAWRETRLIGEAELAQLDAVRFAPVIFQAYVPGVDVRVTVIGEHIFAADIDIGAGEYPVDFRMNYESIRMRPVTLPDSVQSDVRALMASFGLVYGAIDFRRTPGGQYVFLEINPAGQWLFVEQQTGQPITDAVADALVALDRRSPGACTGPPAATPGRSTGTARP